MLLIIIVVMRERLLLSLFPILKLNWNTSELPDLEVQQTVLSSRSIIGTSRHPSMVTPFKWEDIVLVCDTVIVPVEPWSCEPGQDLPSGHQIRNLQTVRFGQSI